MDFPDDGCIKGMVIMEKKAGKKGNLFCIVNYMVLAMGLLTAIYIMSNGLGLIDTLDFGAGAYYYADIPEFAKYTDGTWYSSSVPMWILIVLFMIWGILMYKIWGWFERKERRK